MWFWLFLLSISIITSIFPIKFLYAVSLSYSWMVVVAYLLYDNCIASKPVFPTKVFFLLHPIILDNNCSFCHACINLVWHQSHACIIIVRSHHVLPWWPILHYQLTSIKQLKWFFIQSGSVHESLRFSVHQDWFVDLVEKHSNHSLQFMRLSEIELATTNRSWDGICTMAAMALIFTHTKKIPLDDPNVFSLPTHYSY